MRNHELIRRTLLAPAVLASFLALPGDVRADDVAAARAAAASDPEYTLGYSTASTIVTYTASCRDRSYETREEFTSCGAPSAERTPRDGIASTGARTATAARHDAARDASR